MPQFLRGDTTALLVLTTHRCKVGEHSGLLTRLTANNMRLGMQGLPHKTTQQQMRLSSQTAYGFPALRGCPVKETT